MLPTWEMVARLLLAALLGSLIGLERERLLWAAGLRTHMLVAVGACLIMIVSAFGFGDGVLAPHVILDPSRIAAQVVSGIGFLGAGSIMFLDNKVRGLTTAASVWVVAGIGLAVGGGLYGAAISATAIILIILVGVKPLEDKYLRHRRHTIELTLMARKGEMSLHKLNDALGHRGSRIRHLVIDTSEVPENDKVSIVFERVAPRDMLLIRELIQRIPCVISVDEVA